MMTLAFEPDRPIGEIISRLGIIGETFVVGFGSKTTITKNCFVCYNENALGIGPTPLAAKEDFDENLHFFNLNDHYC